MDDSIPWHIGVLADMIVDHYHFPVEENGVTKCAGCPTDENWPCALIKQVGPEVQAEIERLVNS
jgi:hypothetical protein